MKRIIWLVLSLSLILSLAACSKKDVNSTKSNLIVDSSVSESNSKSPSSVEDNSSDETEELFPDTLGTESEYKITESEAESLFQNSSNVSSGESKDSNSVSSKKPSSENSSKETSSKENSSSKTSSVSSSTSSTASTVSTTSTTSNSNLTAFDKDGDGWTDSWQ